MGPLGIVDLFIHIRTFRQDDKHDSLYSLNEKLVGGLNQFIIQ